MGTASHNSSATRSCCPRETGRRLSQSIPELFQTQGGNMAASRQGPAQTASTLLTDSLPAHTATTSGDDSMPSQHHLSLNDLRVITADIKDTLSVAISDLRLDIHPLADRVHEVEKVTSKHDTAIRSMNHKVDSHTLQPRFLKHHTLHKGALLRYECPRISNYSATPWIYCWSTFPTGKPSFVAPHPGEIHVEKNPWTSKN